MMEESFYAQITLFAGNFEPINWAFCDGRMMQINQNQPLFALLGTMYGGDGRTTFALPDLREKDAQGHPRLGFEIGKPTWIICINGYFPSRY